MSKPTSPKYENNPFYIGLNGFTLLVATAQSTVIFLAVISGLSSLGGILSNPPSQPEKNSAPEEFAQSIRHTFETNPETFLKLGIFMLGIVLLLSLIGAFVRGIADYTAAQLAKGKKVSLKTAAKTVFTEFPGYFWMRIIVLTKTLLWSLLFIVPGFIMSVRYSLAGVAYFADEKRGNQAVKHSVALTKGAWLTTYASPQIWNLITFSIAPLVFSTGAHAILYRQFSAVREKRPKAHFLSWLTILIPILAIILLAIIVLAAIMIFAYSSLHTS